MQKQTLEQLKANLNASANLGGNSDSNNEENVKQDNTSGSTFKTKLWVQVDPA